MSFVQRNLIAAAAAVLLTLAGLRTPAQAELIVSSIDGNIGFFVLVTIALPPPGSPGNLVIEANFAAVSTQFNGAPIPVGNVRTDFDPSFLFITGSSTSGGITTYTFAPNSTEKELEFRPAQGGGEAEFILSFTEALVDAASPSTLILRGTERLVSDTSPLFDFSPFAAGASIAYALTALGNPDFNSILSNGGAAIGGSLIGTSATFSQTVPEPGTLLLLGVGLLVLSGYYRRRRRS